MLSDVNTRLLQQGSSLVGYGSMIGSVGSHRIHNMVFACLVLVVDHVIHGRRDFEDGSRIVILPLLMFVHIAFYIHTLDY